MGDTTTGREQGWGARGSAGFWGLHCSLPDQALSTLPPCTRSLRRFDGAPAVLPGSHA